MTASIIEYPGATMLDLDPDRVLEGAKGELKQALVIGLDHDEQFYMAGSTGDIGDMLLLLALARAKVDQILADFLDR